MDDGDDGAPSMYFARGQPCNGNVTAAESASSMLARRSPSPPAMTWGAPSMAARPTGEPEMVHSCKDAAQEEVNFASSFHTQATPDDGTAPPAIAVASLCSTVRPPPPQHRSTLHLPQAAGAAEGSSSQRRPRHSFGACLAVAAHKAVSDEAPPQGSRGQKAAVKAAMAVKAVRAVMAAMAAMAVRTAMAVKAAMAVMAAAISKFKCAAPRMTRLRRRVPSRTCRCCQRPPQLRLCAPSHLPLHLSPAAPPPALHPPSIAGETTPLQRTGSGGSGGGSGGSISTRGEASMLLALGSAALLCPLPAGGASGSVAALHTKWLMSRALGTSCKVKMVELMPDADL